MFCNTFWIFVSFFLPYLKKVTWKHQLWYTRKTLGWVNLCKKCSKFARYFFLYVIMTASFSPTQNNGFFLVYRDKNNVPDIYKYVVTSHNCEVCEQLYLWMLLSRYESLLNLVDRNSKKFVYPPYSNSTHTTYKVKIMLAFIYHIVFTNHFKKYNSFWKTLL